MTGDTINLIIAIIGLVGGIVALITAIVSRRKEIINRQEIVHRHQGSPTEPKVDSVFVCPHCNGREFKRSKGVRWFWHRVVLGVLLAWPTPFLIVVAVMDQKSPKPGMYLLVIPIFMIPGFVYWWLVRRPMLRCEDCGAKVSARDARGY